MSSFTRALLLICAIFCMLPNAKAQLVPYYTFSQNTGTYAAITTGSVYASGTTVDDQTFAATLPFTFNFDNTAYSQIYISTNGFISFGATDPLSTNYAPISATGTGYEVVAGFGRNLNSYDATTELRTETLGISPNRTFVVQWKNFSYSVSSGIVYNFQIRLHETTNVVDVMYGAMTSVLNTTTGNVGLRGLTSATFNNRSSSTSWSSTTAGAVNTATLTLSPSVTPSSGLTFSWTPPPPCVAPSAQPTGLVLTPAYTSIAGSFTAAVPAADNYLVVRTPNIPMTSAPVNGTAYSVGNALGGGIVVSTSGVTFSSTGLVSNTLYTYTVFAYNATSCTGIKYDTLTPLTGTMETAGPRKYTWIATSGSGSFATATNWSPARNSTDPADTLVFSNGGTVSVTNVPQQNIGMLQVANNTAVSMSSTTNDSLMIGSLFDLSSGSLTLAGAYTLKIGYTSGTTKTGNISGTLNLGGSCGLNTTNSITTVYGAITDSGANAAVTTYCGCSSSLVFAAGGSYNHQRNGGAVPRATYNPSSTVNITGIVNTAPSFIAGVDLGNLTWNCPGQTSSITITNLIAAQGNFNIVSTGPDTLIHGSASNGMNVGGDFNLSGGAYRTTTTTGRLKVLGNVNLTGGVLDLTGNPASAANVINLYVYGDLTQAVTNTITKSGAAGSTISFCGDVHQHISINGSIINAQINYILSNFEGATLTGSLPVNNNASNTINFGSWDGTGHFGYNSVNDTLMYSSTNGITASAVEWPAANQPATLMMNMTGAGTTNRIMIPGNRSLQNTIIITKGILVLNDHDLSITNIYAWVQTPQDTTGMIAADSTGRLVLAVPPLSTSYSTNYVWPIGSTRNGLSFSIVYIGYLYNSVLRNVGIRISDLQHPHDASPTNYVSEYWTVTDDGGSSPYTYSYVSFYFPSTSVVGIPDYRLNCWDGTSWTQLPSHCTTGYATTTASVLSSAVYPLGGRDFAVRPTVSHTYTWTGVTNTDYTVPTNWTPNRTAPDPTDILQFNNGSTDTVSNVTYNDNVSQLRFTNSTTAVWLGGAAPTTGYNYYTIACPDTSAYALKIDSGSALYLAGTAYPFRIFFGYSGQSLVRIAGRLEVQSNTLVDNYISFQGSKAVVTPGGVLAAGSTSFNVLINSDTSNLTINGTYEHKFTTTQNSYPNANYGDQSLLLIDGFTTCTAGPNQDITTGYVHYNCPAQTANMAWNELPHALHDFDMISTGTGSMKLNNVFTGYSYGMNNYYQTGGYVDINNVTLNVQGTFSQIAGTFMTSATGTNAGTLNLNGAAPQSVSFQNAAPAGPMIYRVSNPAGITLAGTGTLTAAFNINSGGGVRISVPVSNPVTTALTLQYDTTNSTLTYDTLSGYTTAAYMADATVYPAVNGPVNLTVNIGDASTLTQPFTRTVPGTLTMTRGDLLIGANTLTIGKSALATGALAWTSGYIVPGSGSVVRWYPTNGLPTAAGTAIGYYPLKINGNHRSISLYFNTSIALSAAGTIGVSSADVGGLTTGLSFADGAATITNRANAPWNFTAGSGIALSGSVNARITAGGLYPAYGSANLHLVQASGVVGTHVTGSGVSPDKMVTRIGMSIADITSGNFYVGAPDTTAAVSGPYISVANGNWSTAATWNLNAVPPAGSVVYIANNTTVTVDIPACVSKVVTVYPGSTLTGAAAGKLTVDSAVTNNGTINITADTLLLGPAGGGKAPFVSNGTLSVSSGNLYVNGSVRSTNGSIFNQTGGDIFIDGNANDVAANSVPSTSGLLRLDTCYVNAIAGNITFIDPHVSATYALLDYTSTGPGFGGTHTFYFGNGVSTTSGGGYGFYVFSAVPLNNVIVQGSPSGTNRRALQSGNLTINGNLTLVNTNAEYCDNSQTLTLLGNMNSGAGTFFDLYGTLQFANPTQPQSVNGTGTFRNFYVPSTADFTELIINNGSDSGVTLNISNPSFSSIIIFTKGNLRVANGTLYNVNNSNIITPGQTTGWVIGKYMIDVPAAGYPYLMYPVGDSNYYTPVYIRVPSGAVLNTGRITVSTTGTDHPAIASSEISPSRSINRYYSIDTSAGLRLASYSTTVTAYWNVADEDPALAWGTLIANAYSDSVWSEHTVTLLTPVSAQITNLGNDIDGVFQLGARTEAPYITLQPANQTVCQGSNATFTAAATSATGYQWQVNTGGGWTNVTNGTAYSGATSPTLSVLSSPVTFSGYLYRCDIYNTIDTAVTNIATLSVTTAVTPLVTITPAAGDTLCPGMTAAFSATAVNGGALPILQWTVNSVNVTTGTSFNYTTPANHDTVRCILTSSAGCVTSLTATSPATVLVVGTVVSPTISIASSVGATVCVATTVTFTATVLNGGPVPHYQWKKNGVNTGSDNITYTDNTLVTGDVITCVVTSGYPCALPATATSNAITMTVNTPALPVITLTTTGSDTVCAGANLACAANTNITGATYQWYVNGTAVSGATNASYNYIPTDNDHVTCTATAPAGSCYTAASVTSVATIVSVHPYITPAVSIAGTTSLCAHTADTFTATGNVTGATCQWFVNGISAGTGTTLTDTPGNANHITAVLTVPASGCFTTSTATSNMLTITVIADTMPVMSIITAHDTVCAGTGITLSGTTNITAPGYHWMVNGVLSGSAASYAYVPVNGDVIKCVLIMPAGCYNVATDTSNSIHMTVLPVATPTVTLTGTTTVCAGTSVTETATTNVAGGTWHWTVNGTTVSSTTNSYTFIPANGDVVACTITAVSGCYSAPTATATVTITVDPVLVPGVILAVSDTSVCEGVQVGFVGNTTVAGGTFQWQLNGVNVGSGTSAYNYTPANGDVVRVIVTAPAGSCYSPGIDTSNSVAITVTPFTVPSITISGPVTPVAPGAIVNLTAVVSNAGPSYQIVWIKNSATFSTTTTPATSYTKAAGTDIITGKVSSTSSVGCYDTTVSASITILEDTTGAGVDDVTGSNDISLFPNPSSGTVTLTGLHANDVIRLVDMAGRTVASDVQITVQEEKHTFILSELTPASYLLSVVRDGKIIKNFRLQKVM